MIQKISLVFWLFFIVPFFSSPILSQNVSQVTDETEGVTDFVWSPDGSRFAYTAMIDDTSRLFLIDMDGTNRIMLTDSMAFGKVDWKGSVITFGGSVGPDNYDGLIKRINPDGSNETRIIGPYWLHSAILRADANWLLYSDGPNGWWQARRCDLNGDNNLILETTDLVQQLGWLGKNHVIYARGTNYNTVCAIHKIDFNGGGRVQLTPATLPNNALFIATPDTSKILYCDGSADSWNIWVMDTDGNNKTQLTTDPAHDYLSNTRDNICSIDGKSFFFTSDRSGSGDIYRLHLDGTGLIQMTNHDSTDYNPIPSPDGRYLAFISKRDAVNNIWVMNIPPSISSITDVPDDQGGQVTIVWKTQYKDLDLGNISYYSIWRALPEITVSQVKLVSPNVISKDFSGEAYIQRTLNGQEYAWEWIANQPAHNFVQYSYTASTLYDSMSTTDGMHHFFVSAHYTEPNTFYDSNVESGFSVDNLPPLPPGGLAGIIADNTIELNWNESTELDFRYYKIYRNNNFYRSTSNLSYTDTDIQSGQTYAYRLKAVDIHENESDFSGEVSFTITNIVSHQSEIPEFFDLSQNYPNPFNPSTTIEYALKERVHVELIIYTISGQRIKKLVDESQSAGYKHVVWNGLDENGSEVSNGVYIYRIKAGNFIKTNKMVYIK